MCVTLDGVFEEPGNRSLPFWSDEAMKINLDEIFASDAYNVVAFNLTTLRER